MSTQLEKHEDINIVAAVRSGKITYDILRIIKGFERFVKLVVNQARLPRLGGK